ncbi:MAG: protease modulator HflC [candidate division NC10 bacterium]|nr:protease modulator HflC [candidate division NC10 bacterium]
MVQLIVVLIILAVLGLPQAAYVIPEWQQAIVTRFGQPIRTVREPGLYLKLPLIHTLIRFEKRVLATDAMPGEYLTRDKKRLAVDHISRWEIADPLQFFRTMRDERGAMARLDDIITARLRQEIAKEDFKAIIRERRAAIMETVTAATRELTAPFGIRVVDVRIRRADLPPEVQASVFARMQAERQRIALRYRAEGEEKAREVRAEADKEREIILAKAYADAQRLRGEGDARATAVTGRAFGRDPGFYGFLRRLETYERIFAQGTTVVLPSNSDLLRYLESPRPRR